MKIAVNAVATKLGGAATYLSNMLPELGRQMEPGDQAVVWRAKGGGADEPISDRISYREEDRATGGDRAIGGRPYRLWFDQVRLPAILKREQFDVLFSSSNFGPLICPCRQVLLVRNTAYFDPLLMSRMPDLRVRAYYRFQRWLTLRCMAAADVVLFPSQSMRDLVGGMIGGPRPHWLVAPYGTRHDLIQPLPRPPMEGRRPVALLNVSLYSDQKNLGTLMGAVDQLQAAQPGRFQLTTTAGFDRDWLAGSRFCPAFQQEAGLFRRLRAGGVARDLPQQSYPSTIQLYAGADLFVFPSYTESFGHPLVEAMASGLPIVAADTPVNRELCGEAAIYFATFDAVACARAIRQVAENEELAARLRAAGSLRAKEFTWERHVRELLRAFRKT